MLNPFTAVSREDHQKLGSLLADTRQARDDAQREASGVRVELRREVENAERLTALAARAVQSAEIYRLALIERQIGAKRDPSLVLVVNNLPDAPKKRHGFTPLKKRRREAQKRNEAAEVRRNALPKLTADLPPVPLTAGDLEAMREVLTTLERDPSKENQ
jgi:hypothetical protein